MRPLTILFVPIFLLAAGLSGCATESGAAVSGGQTPRTLTARDYYPLTVGNKWTYKAEPGGEVRNIEIVRQEEGFFIDSNMPPSRLQTRPTGVFDGDRFLLEDPLEVGHTWVAVPSASTVERYEIVETELELSTPAGYFKECVRVRAEAPGRTDQGVPMKLIMLWTYAPDVGLIRIEQRVQIGDEAARDAMKIELVSYELQGAASKGNEATKP